MGRLIVIEGLDGSGKATQAGLLAVNLRGKGMDVEELSFPCYDDESSLFVRRYLEGDFGESPFEVNCYAASMFFALDRYVSFQKRWGLKYKAGGLFVADRYTTSNAVYQMAKLDEDEWDSFLRWLTDFEQRKLAVPKPDKVIYLDVEPSLGERLMLERYGGDAGKLDIHERNMDFQKRGRKAALYCAKAQGWTVIDCGKGGEMRCKEEIAREVLGACGGIFQPDALPADRA